MRFLFVEDDLAAARAMVLLLRSSSIVVDHTASGVEGLELARRYDYDLVILDLTLPDINGMEVVRRMRRARVNTPVLIVSGLAAPDVKVAALTAGADDFLTKPFDRAELIARTQTLVRRARGFAESRLRVGNVELDLNSHDVWVGNQAIRITGKEYVMLELMMLRKGTAVSKEAFLNHMYGGLAEPEPKIIDVFLCKLRKKLAVAGADNLIATVWGRGYMIRELREAVKISTELPVIQCAA